MKNIDYEEVFKKKRLELQNDIICIREVPSEYIKELDPNNSGDGHIDARAYGNDFINIIIYVNKDMTYEKKLRVMFHEYGHALHFIKLGRNEIQRLREQDDYLWNVLTETEAYRNNLEESITIYHEGNAEFLKNTIKELESVSFPPHSEAIANIKKEQIWSQCLNIINGNPNE